MAMMYYSDLSRLLFFLVNAEKFHVYLARGFNIFFRGMVHFAFSRGVGTNNLAVFLLLPVLIFDVDNE